MKGCRNMDEKALIKQNKFLKIALIVSIVLLVVCSTKLNSEIRNYVSENEELKAQIEEQNDTISELEDWKETKYSEVIEALEADYNELVDKNEELKSEYSNLKFDYDELEIKKSIPVYYCRHNENSAITVLRAFIDYAPEIEGYGHDDEGNSVLYVDSNYVSEYNMWIYWFAEACDYDSYDAAGYLDDDENVAKMFDEVYDAYKSHYNAWFGLEEDEEEE